tara:strand:- start:676 stop:1056 length:381 start_codon:yes stop_codon:yes gene_type:complete
MKNYKILICLISLLVLSSSFSNIRAQNKIVTQNFLMNKKWKMSGFTDKTTKDEFNQTIIKPYYNSTLIGESYYYLSKKIDPIFDEFKVGKIGSGKYIISKVKHANNETQLSYFYIIVIKWQFIFTG